MRADDVNQVLDTLDRAGVHYWVAGGWGVAALAGQQTREHRDLDLAVNAKDLCACLSALSDLGYAAETDWLPVRMELAAPCSARTGTAVRQDWRERISTIRPPLSHQRQSPGAT